MAKAAPSQVEEDRLIELALAWDKFLHTYGVGEYFFARYILELREAPNGSWGEGASSK